MAQITIKSDNQLQQTPIVIPLATPGKDEINNNRTGFNTDIKQTLLYGIRIPLVKVNDIVVDAQDILYMELNGMDIIPRLELTIKDSTGTIKGLQQPSSDNEVRIQILPRMDNAYKKIDMTFYITNTTGTDGDEDELRLSCIYKVLNLYNNHVKCFGRVSTYEMFEKLAHECKLGFASNVEGSNDERYLYAPNISYLDFMNNAIKTSGDSGNSLESKVMYNYWIDFWNNINFVDIYERFNTIEPDDQIKIYISKYEQTMTQDSNDDEVYMHVPAVLSNHPLQMESELFIDSYDPVNNTSVIGNGSDRVITIYNMNDGEAIDYLLQDGDQKKDLVTKAVYMGENYEEFNYLLASECRNFMNHKMLSETIEVTVHSPLIQLMKGGKVNIKWYDINPKLARTKEKLGIKDDDIATNIEVETPETTEENTDLRYHINKQITGQYYILGNIITFENGEWSNRLKLTRPKDQKSQYIDMQEATKQIK